MVIKQKVEAKGFCIKNKKQKTEKTKNKKQKKQNKTKKKKKKKGSSQGGYIFFARVEQIIIYIFSLSLV